MKEQMLKVAVAGNPNSGKSTLINSLAGSNLQVGNWTGVTVEKREAILDFADEKIRLVDLPGTYGLSPFSDEEIISRHFLITEAPDVIINVLDTTNLERNLPLTLELLELGYPMVLALNMTDEAEEKGVILDVEKLESLLGVPAVKTVATKHRGLNELLENVLEQGNNKDSYTLKPLQYSESLDHMVKRVTDLIQNYYKDLEQIYPAPWIIYRLIAQDPDILERPEFISLNQQVQQCLIPPDEKEETTLEEMLEQLRYQKAADITECVFINKGSTNTDITDKIDNWFLHPWLGLPLFLGSIWLIFKLTFDLSTPFVDWIDGFFTGPVSHWLTWGLQSIQAPDWFTSLMVEGIVGGVGFVLVFVPIIFVMMFFISFLEGSGYMARAAFVMDRIMHVMGLHGKSFIPMLMGFGCNVPAVYATRTLDTEKDRILTALLIPLMSCGARLPVYVLFTGIFFPKNSGTVLFSIYLLGIVLSVLIGVLFKNTLFRGQSSLLVMELPPYRIPPFKSLMLQTWEKVEHFLVKAGTYILGMSIIIWFLFNLPWGVENKKDSWLGVIGQQTAPILSPIGFGTWEAASSLITGVIAKEVIVSTFGVIYVDEKAESDEPVQAPDITEDIKQSVLSLGQAFLEAGKNVISTAGVASMSMEDDSDNSLREKISSIFSPLSAYAFMAFVLIYAPCLVTAAAMRQEFGSWKWFWFTLVYSLILGWLVAFAIYQGGMLLGLGG